MKSDTKKMICMICAGLLSVLMFVSAASPAYAAASPEKPKIVSSDDEDQFTEKTISASSKNKTDKYKAKKVAAKKPDKVFAKAAADASLKLLKETMKQTKGGKNVLISPDSIITASMIMGNGAKGKTRTEIEKAFGKLSIKKYNQYLASLHKKLGKSDLLTYKVANSIWYKAGSISIKKAYLQKLVDYYGAEVYAAPFEDNTVTDINSWVYNNTKGKIDSILERLEPQARVVLLNAVYFKGSWADPYSDTVKRKFTKANGKKQTVDMLEGVEHTYVNIGGADGFVKYYSGGDMAFLGILPPKGMTVDQYVNKLKGSDIVNGYKKRQTDHIDVFTRMPQFKYDYSISMNDVFRKMGVKKAFTDSADFSYMSGQPVAIDDILHKTFINLDKDGTEAAAVTAMVMKASSAYDPEKRIRKKVYLNRPFVYAIIDTKTGMPMFIGVVKQI